MIKITEGRQLMKGPFQKSIYTVLLIVGILSIFALFEPVFALTIVNQGPGLVFNYAPNNVVSVAVTTEITKGTTISWGLNGGTGNLNLGSITIPAGQSVGFGSGTIPEGTSPGSYTLSATEGTATASGESITVQGPPPTPTQPPVITQVEGTAVDQIVGVYRSRKTEVQISGTCQYAGETIEILLGGTLVDQIFSTGTNWGATVTVPADGEAKTISARNAAGASNSVQVLVDMTNPTFRIEYSPASPFGTTPSGSPIKVRVTASEEVRDVHLDIILPSTGLGVPVNNFQVVGASGATSGLIWEGEIEITESNGTPSINGTPTTNGVHTMMISGFDMAKPDPGNLGTQITAGETFVVEVSGPNSSGAKVSIENDKIYTNSRDLHFTWNGFTHSLGNNHIQTYWYKAFPKTDATLDPGPNDNTSGWTSFPSTDPASDPYSSMITITGDGTYAVFVKASDTNDQFSSAVYDDIIVDTTGPVAQNPNPASGANSTEPQQTISVRLVETGSGIKNETVNMRITYVDKNGTNVTKTFGLSGTANQYASPALTMYKDPTDATKWVLQFNPANVPGGMSFSGGQVSVVIPETLHDNLDNPLGGTSGAPGVPYTWTFNVTVNGDAPVPMNPKPSSGYINNKRQPIQLSLFDEDGIDGDTVILDINGVSYNPVQDTALSLTGPANPSPTDSESVLLFTPPMDFNDGTVQCILRKANDKIGNAYNGPYEWNFFIDTTPPVVSSPNPGDNTTIEDGMSVISANVKDALSGVAGDSIEISLIYQSSFSNTPDTPIDISVSTSSAATYNPTTGILSINPRMIPEVTSKPWVQGSVTVILKTIHDLAVSYDMTNDTTSPNPNSLSTPYEWRYFIGNSAGPILADPVPAKDSLVNTTPLEIRFTLADLDGIDHSSLLFDFNGKTYRDGDYGLSWTTGTTSIMTGTHEIVVFTPAASTIVQGTNELRVREAKDRTGKALQNSPVNLDFQYDSEGPKFSSDSTIPPSVIYDEKQQVTFELTDNYSGVDGSTVMLSISDGTNNFGPWGTGTDPTVLQAIPDGTNAKIRFIPPSSFKYESGKSYEFHILTNTMDKAKNRIGKEISTPSDNHTGSEATFTLRMSDSTEVIILDSPANDSYVNVTNSSFKFDWHGPASGANNYELVISDNLSFNNSAPNHTWRYQTKDSEFMSGTLAIDLQHGNSYYWYVEAVDTTQSTSNPYRYAKSEVRTFHVDNLPPTTPDIREIIDYKNVDPNHVNYNPYSNTTYVRNKDIRVKVYCHESPSQTEGYKMVIYNTYDNGGTCVGDCILGSLDKPVCQYTNEVNITLPVKDGLYRIYSKVVDRAGNESVPSQVAEVYYDTTEPKVEQVTFLDRSPGSNGYITSGQTEIIVKFNDTLDLLPLEDYKVKPSIKIDPAGGGAGTGPIELSNISISGKTIKGTLNLPYGNSALYDGMCDVHVTGVMDQAYNVMASGYYVEQGVFEIDTAPGFEVKTFLNPIDEKNVLVNIYASETIFGKPTLWIKTSDGIPHNVDVNIMERNLFAATYPSEIGENMIRVSGQDANGNMGFFPSYDSIGESTFLSHIIARNAPSKMASKTMGVELQVAANSVSRNTNMYIFPYKREWATEVKGVSRMIMKELSPELVDVGVQYNISPSRVKFRKPALVKIDLKGKIDDKKLSKVALYKSTDGVNFEYLTNDIKNGVLSGKIDRGCIVGAFMDDKAPVIRNMNVKNGETFKTDAPVITADILENGSGISASTVEFIVDGKKYPVKYDNRRKKIIFEPKNGLLSGSHKLELVVYDRVGNKSPVKSVTFNIPKVKPEITKLVSYPNPAMVMTTIRGTLNGVSVTDGVEVEIWIYSSSGRRITKLTPMVTGTGFTAIWNLENRRGRRVANGVYFYKVKAKIGNKYIRKNGKIAVLR